MPSFAYDMSGKRLAEKGYAYAEEPAPERIPPSGVRRRDLLDADVEAPA